MNTLYRAKRKGNDELVIGEYFSDSEIDKHFIRIHISGEGYPNFIPPTFYDVEIEYKTLTQFTDYYINGNMVFFGDKVSNNFGTDKEVIREIVEYEGCKMMKRIKGESKLPEYISLHEFYGLNFKIICDAT